MPKASTTKKPRPYHHGDLRQALVDASLEVISERDVSGLSLREVARRVGVTYAAPYHHFKDKNALLAALAAEGFRMMRAEMDRQRAALPDDPSPIAQLGARGRGYIRFAIEHPTHYRVMFRTDLADPALYPDMHSEAESCYGQLIEAVTKILGAGATEEAVGKLATTVWSTVHGASTLWNDGDHSKMPTDDPSELVEMVIGQLNILLSAQFPDS